MVTDLVEKRIFEVNGPYRTVGGAVIAGVRVGYETLGRLSPSRDNAILIPHYNTGNSHFAGRYRADDPLPGYWDAITGPGCPLDSDRWFLIGVDCLTNVNAKDPFTVTTGPASIDPATGKPYGMRFPTVQIADFVTIQKALLDHLGISRLRAVMGASMGSMQTFQWAAAFPAMVERIIAVIPSAFLDDYTALRLRSMRQAIMLDPHWQGGDYYGGPEPEAGLALALSMMTIASLDHDWSQKYFNRRWADPLQDPAADIGHRFAAADWIDQQVGTRLPLMDANNFLYLQRANELFTLGGKASLEEGLKLIQAKVLVLPSATDHILPVSQARRARDILIAQGNQVDYLELAGPFGHLNGIATIAQAGDLIRQFLEK